MLLVASIAILLAVCDAMPAARLQVNGLTFQQPRHPNINWSTEHQIDLISSGKNESVSSR